MVLFGGLHIEMAILKVNPQKHKKINTLIYTLINSSCICRYWEPGVIVDGYVPSAV